MISGLVGVQRGLGRHLHHPADEAHGYGGVKAGAIETASSVNGQIMPPVMGAAAFLMVEYVGIPYTEIIKHAFLPAVISYIALFYIVHLEALKLGMQPMAQARSRRAAEADRLGPGHHRHHRGLQPDLLRRRSAKRLFGDAAPWVLGRCSRRSTSIRWLRRVRTPPDIDVDNPVLPETWPTVKAGLHFLIPIVVLLWCLMIEELSPGCRRSGPPRS